MSRCTSADADHALFGDGRERHFVRVPQMDDAVRSAQCIPDVGEGAFGDLFRFQRFGEGLRELVEDRQALVLFGQRGDKPQMFDGCCDVVREDLQVLCIDVGELSRARAVDVEEADNLTAHNQWCAEIGADCLRLRSRTSTVENWPCLQ